ncbi:MAG: thioredoxin domain-containing protein [Deltaproteobacteria bacterium]|nr:thioredoxin domain-containing protein [Deltaproteobacteria bacterium]
MKTKHLLILLILILAGLAVSGYLTVRHFDILKEGFEHKSICNINGKFDCDSVIISTYSKLGPFPVSGLGLLFYIYALLAMAYAFINREESAATLTFPLLGTYPALGFSIYLGLVSSYIIKSYCLFCVSLYFITFLFFIFIHLFFPKQPTRLNFLKDFFQIGNTKQRETLRSSFFGHLAFLLIFFLITLAALYANEKKYTEDLEDFDHQAFLDFHYIEPQYTFDIQNHASWGNPDAPIKIVEFSDFECPHCKRAAATLKPYLRQYLKKIQFIYMSYPLDKSCNPYMQRDLHQNACTAAMAAYCAQDQNKFWEMHDKIFEEQTRLSSERFPEFAKGLGLDENKFNQCLKSNEHLDTVKKDIEMGNQAQVNGTPGVFVNGRKLEDWLNPIKINLLIEEELKRSEK